jgi:hypothetical protein
MAPEGAAVPTPKPRRDETLIKALVRAHRWRRKIESGQARSITDLAELEGVTDAYVCPPLPLLCVTPDILEAILDGRQLRKDPGWLRCWGMAAGMAAIGRVPTRGVGVAAGISVAGRAALAHAAAAGSMRARSSRIGAMVSRVM